MVCIKNVGLGQRIHAFDGAVNRRAVGVIAECGMIKIDARDAVRAFGVACDT